MNCLNCDTALLPEHKYCYSCGQKYEGSKLTLGHVSHEAFHAFTHADSGMFRLIKELAYKPGFIARNYVEGKRKSLFNPFSFLFIIIGISSLILAKLHIMDLLLMKDPVSSFMNRSMNLMMIVAVPFIAFGHWLFFKREGVTYADSLVLTAYTSGERSIFFSLVIIPLIFFFPAHGHFFIFIYMLVFAFYFAFASTQFSQRPSWRSYLKGFASFAVAQLIITILISIAIAIYYFFFAKSPHIIR